MKTALVFAPAILFCHIKLVTPTDDGQMARYGNSINGAGAKTAGKISQGSPKRATFRYIGNYSYVSRLKNSTRLFALLFEKIAYCDITKYISILAGFVVFRVTVFVTLAHLYICQSSLWFSL